MIIATFINAGKKILIEKIHSNLLTYYVVTMWHQNKRIHTGKALKDLPAAKKVFIKRVKESIFYERNIPGSEANQRES